MSDSRDNNNDPLPDLSRSERESLPILTERKELVSLKGLARTEDGRLTRSNYFKFLNMDLDSYDDIQMTPDQAKSIHQHLLKLSTGSTAMTPMYCGGDMCPFKLRCPLWQIGQAPVGKQCLWEVELMKTWITDYMREYDVDPNNTTELAYVREMAELDILEMRINMNLSMPQNAELVTENTIGVDREGDPITQKTLSPFMEAKNQIANRRSRIVKLMVGDRQEKYKKEAALKIKDADDPSSKMAAMRAQVEQLTRGLDTVQKDLESQQNKKEPETQETPKPGGMSAEDFMNSL